MGRGDSLIWHWGKSRIPFDPSSESPQGKDWEEISRHEIWHNHSMLYRASEQPFNKTKAPDITGRAPDEKLTTLSRRALVSWAALFRASSARFSEAATFFARAYKQLEDSATAEELYGDMLIWVSIWVYLTMLIMCLCHNFDGTPGLLMDGIKTWEAASLGFDFCTLKGGWDI